MHRTLLKSASVVRNFSLARNTAIISPIRFRSVQSPEKVADLDKYLKLILTSRVYDVCIETPIHYAEALSRKTGNEVFFKREDMQPVFSFKLRGAYNKLANLSEEQKRNGVICCSAGNHAQGVAFSCAHLNIDAVIVMPIPTPEIKVQGVRRHGGINGNVKVILHGNNYDEAQAEAQRLEKEENRTMIHPYDDPYVIAGQGTVGAEIVRQTISDPPDAIFCCVGGGGLVSGVLAFIKSIRPQIKIYSVEAEDAAAMQKSLACGERILLDSVGLFADGAAVKKVGVEPFRLCNALIDGAITVNTDELCVAVRDCFNDTRTVMEPAGALAIAGLTKYSKDHQGQKLMAITSGANMNFDRLRFISERAIPNEVLLNIEIPETPGSFLTMYDAIAPRNVTEFSYRYSDHQSAQIMCSLSVKDEQDAKVCLERLNTNGMSAIDLSNNEVAKVHGRYLVGGPAPSGEEEILCRFIFPEMPGALGHFLRNVNGRWNFSLFHYRNHGADVGQVLVGLQVPPSERGDFQQFLDTVGFDYTIESENPAYQAFLKRL